MKITKLKNGLEVVYIKKPTDSVAIQIMVKTGSNYENKKISGISHFIEHMLFEGTKKYHSSRELANEVEKYGGDLNAYTSEERTAYHVKIIKKHFEKALDILEQIMFNPLFREQDIEKERSIILDEIKLVTDEPRHHQWVFFGKNLFKKHPSRNPAYGTVEAVKSITKKDIEDYYDKYYAPNNMIISVVGDINQLEKKIKKRFEKYKSRKTEKRAAVKEPKQTKPVVAREKRRLSNSYVVFGYRTPERLHKDSYVLDVIRAILGRGQSGRMFYKIRTKLGLAYEVGVHHEPSTDYGFLAVYCGTDKKNISKIKKVIIEELDFSSISDKEIKEAKEFIEGNHKLHTEDTYNLADSASYWSLMGRTKGLSEYLSKIKKVNKKQITETAKKYFTKNYVLAILEQK